MIHFEKEFFRKVDFTQEEIKRFFKSALHDLTIAQKDAFPEVCFSYGFQALIKAGIALISKVGKVKVRSMPGHHAKILAKMSEIMENPDILTIGDAMRTRRNTDLYGGGVPIGKKEAEDYLKFVEDVIQSIERKISQK